MLVGHLPHLSKLAAYLISHDESQKIVEFQASTIVCLGRDTSGNWSIQWIINPDDVWMGSTMRDKILKKLATLHSTYPGRMLVVVSLLTVIFVGLSTQLKLTLRWSDLLPSNDKRTLEFNKIIEEFRTATSIVIVVTGEERRIKQFADTLVPRLLSAVDTGKNVSLWKDIEKLNKKILILMLILIL